MEQTDLAASLREFVTKVTRRIETDTEESELLPRIGESMRRLVATDDWLDPAFARPHPRYYQQYLLYADPDDRFSVVSFVWGPGQGSPIHNHTVWGVIGMLRGAEITQNYEIDADGKPHAVSEERELAPGDVEFVSPTIGDVHRVRNALNDRASVSIHAYGANIGTVKRHIFGPRGGPPREFVSGYANVDE